MNWQRKNKYYATSGPFTICWTDEKPTLFMCSHKGEYIGKSYKIDEAKGICDRYNVK